MDEVGGHSLTGPVADALRPVRAQVLALRDRAGWALSDAESLDSIRSARQLRAALEALDLSLLAALQSRPEAVEGAAPGKTAATFLTEALRVSRTQAGRDVTAAKAVAAECGAMPALAAAFAAGEVSREHVDVAVAAVNRLPAAVKKLVTDEGVTGLQVLDGLVTEQAKTGPAGTVAQLGKDLLMVVDPDRACRLDQDAVTRRGGSHSVDLLGMHLIRIVLDPATGAQVMPVIAAYAKPAPAGSAQGQDGQEMSFPDPRTHSQLLADAFADIVRVAAAARGIHTPDTDTDPETDTDTDTEAEAGGRGGRCGGCGGSRAADRSWWGGRAPVARVTPELVVITTWDQLAAAQGVCDVAAQGAGLARVSLAGGGGDWPGSGLDPTTLGRLACDAVLRRVVIGPNGAAMNLGRAARLASASQRKALFARDGGCVIPGCGIPADWCEVHHVVPWSEGGNTDVQNMCLLCPRHHTAVHARIWQILMTDGIPWVRPPSWIDVRRRLFRNTTHEHRHRARRTAQNLTRQLRLPLHPLHPPAVA